MYWVCKIFTMVLLLIPLVGLGGEVTVKSVTAQQRYPWNGKVDIAVTLEGDVGDWVECSFSAINSETKASIPVKHLTNNGDDTRTSNTLTRKFIWDATADAGEVEIADVTLTVDVKGLGGVQLWDNGPCWAERNVGASIPEGSGYYFWWGDTVGYKYNENNYTCVSSRNGATFSFTLDNCLTAGKSITSLRSAGYIDSTGNLTAAHDAASVHLGAPWRMPTDAEMTALGKNCDTEITTRNGVRGMLATGRGKYAKRSIFLPAVGYVIGSLATGKGYSGYYWSSTPDSDCNQYAWCQTVASGPLRTNYFRYWGQTVRAVRLFGAAPSSGSAVRTSSLAHLSSAMAHLALNCSGNLMASSAGERLYYDASWIASGATARVYEGTTLLASGTKGSVLWQPKICSREARVVAVQILNSSGFVVATEEASFSTLALEHSEKVTTAAKSSTCTTAGCTKGSYCTRCNATLSTSTTLARSSKGSQCSA